MKNILHIICNAIRVNADWSFKASEKDTKQSHLSSPYESCCILSLYIFAHYQPLAVNVCLIPKSYTVGYLNKNYNQSLKLRIFWASSKKMYYYYYYLLIFSMNPAPPQ